MKSFRILKKLNSEFQSNAPTAHPFNFSEEIGAPGYEIVYNEVKNHDKLKLNKSTGIDNRYRMRF